MAHQTVAASVGASAAPWWTIALAAIALPFLLVPLNLRLVVHNLSFYEVEFRRYRIEAFTGISSDDLTGTARALMGYFDGSTEPFSYRLENGQAVYGPREVAHLRDVKALLRMGDGIGLIAIASVVAAVWLQRRLGRARQFDALARSMVSGSLATLGLLASLALLAVTDFSGAFLQFHYLAFSNDLWQLDPRTDNLIRMFPEGFFLDATLLIALATAVEAVLLLGLGLVLRRHAAASR